MCAVATPQTTSKPAQPELILASGSPRRAQLLQQMGFTPRIVPPNVDETWPDGQSPEVGVLQLAQRKLQAVAPQHPQAIVLAADTIVVLDGAILGKPDDSGHAIAMLSQLAGKRHQVWTGCSLQLGQLCWQRAVCTHILMRPLPAEEIARYVATKEPLDKAGACCIQGLGGALIDTIEGSYTNVIGLPVQEVLLGLHHLMAPLSP